MQESYFFYTRGFITPLVLWRLWGRKKPTASNVPGQSTNCLSSQVCTPEWGSGKRVFCSVLCMFRFRHTNQGRKKNYTFDFFSSESLMSSGICSPSRQQISTVIALPHAPFTSLDYCWFTYLGRMAGQEFSLLLSPPCWAHPCLQVSQPKLSKWLFAGIQWGTSSPKGGPKAAEPVGTAHANLL